MSKNNFWWRKIFSGEYTRADYDCEEVWIRNDNYRLLIYPNSVVLNTYGKWCLFDPNDAFIDRIESKNPPFNWADNKINIYKKENS